jgi:hypothetical protein
MTGGLPPPPLQSSLSSLPTMYYSLWLVVMIVNTFSPYFMAPILRNRTLADLVDLSTVGTDYSNGPGSRNDSTSCYRSQHLLCLNRLLVGSLLVVLGTVSGISLVASSTKNSVYGDEDEASLFSGRELRGHLRLPSPGSNYPSFFYGVVEKYIPYL